MQKHKHVTLCFLSGVISCAAQEEDDDDDYTP